MAAARGLGKGLDALIPSGISSSSGSAGTSFNPALLAARHLLSPAIIS